MNKRVTILLSVIAVLVILTYLYKYFFEHLYSIDFDTYKQYSWILKDSAAKDIDPKFGASYTKKNNIYNLFHCKCFIDTNNTINCHNAIMVWEFKDLTNIDLNKVFINANTVVSNGFKSAQVFNDDGYLPVAVKDNFEFKGEGLNIDLDKSSTIIKRFDSTNYKGFYGAINKLSLCDENDHEQIILTYAKEQNPVVFLVYKARKSFFVISVNEEDGHHIDETVINTMLNLK